MAYLFSNKEYFDIKAITVNATRNRGGIEGHFDEANRVIKLFKIRQEIPLLKGADKSFIVIKDSLENLVFDGFEAVDFIISEARKYKYEKWVVIAVGKLTNLAKNLL